MTLHMCVWFVIGWMEMEQLLAYEAGGCEWDRMRNKK